MSYYVYILQSMKDNKSYIGSTSNLVARLNFHNSGLQRSTRHRTLFKLVYPANFGITVKGSKPVVRTDRHLSHLKASPATLKDCSVCSVRNNKIYSFGWADKQQCHNCKIHNSPLGLVLEQCDSLYTYRSIGKRL